jgi:UDP-N-acetylmuramoyl-tripeptide--D-alanyl-D-alanine ligase
MRAQGGPYIAGNVANACNGRVVYGDLGAVFKAITTDSRTVEPDDLFVPLSGPNFDGHDFVLPALEAGARGCLVDREVNGNNLKRPTNSVLIQVKDTLLALSDLASAHRTIHTHPLIAVTGSSGKTTVKEMIATVLGRSHRPLVSQKNFNNMIGLPMTVLSLGPQYDSAVVEAGINTSGEMDHLARAACPDVAVITTIGPVHLEGLGTIENVAREKFRLARHTRKGGKAVVPFDDPHLKPLLKECSVEMVSFGIEEGDFRAADIRSGVETTFEMITPLGNRHIRLNLPGRHNVGNSLATAAACTAIGVSLNDVEQGLREFTTPSLRMEIINLPGNRILIRDCYNANPQSVSAALDVLSERGRQTRTLALLADMAELGGESERLHRAIGAKAAHAGVDLVVFLGSFGGSVEEGFLSGGGYPSSFVRAADREEAWSAIRDRLNNFGAILVKGSRVTRMELVADRILEEG